MVCVLRDARKLWTLCRSAGKELQCRGADGFCGIQIDRNADIAWERFILILRQVDCIAGIIDEIVTIAPFLSSQAVSAMKMHSMQSLLSSSRKKYSSAKSYCHSKHSARCPMIQRRKSTAPLQRLKIADFSWEPLTMC